MPKNKKPRKNVFAAKIDERRVLVALTIILIASVVVLIIQENEKRKADLPEPITIEQSLN